MNDGYYAGDDLLLPDNPGSKIVMEITEIGGAVFGDGLHAANLSVPKEDIAPDFAHLYILTM